MNVTGHTFHIPVMGTGHSADTPIRVAPYGIGSVVSLVDDMLLEKLRAYYTTLFDLPYEPIPLRADDGRARRITAYLDTVGVIVMKKVEEIKSQPFLADSEKDRYFEMLPDFSELKIAYNKLKTLGSDNERDDLEQSLTEAIVPGSIDVNIMVKLDKPNKDRDGNVLPQEFSDALAALRGFAKSAMDSAMIFSAGLNNTLFGYMAEFEDFYYTPEAPPKKKIIIKVSDFRSALIQGKYLAKKGLDVFEFRIESGLNCGGHAFPTAGNLLPGVLREFKEKRDDLNRQLKDMVIKYYEKRGKPYPEWAKSKHPMLTVQGGIGTVGEDERCRDYYGTETTGWCSPFLLVPEATCLDQTTRTLLANAQSKDLYPSAASPLRVLFNNVRGSGSNLDTRGRYEAGKAGAPCKNFHLVSDTEFTDEPICLASRKYQKLKLAQIEAMDASDAKKTRLRDDVVAKECICYNLGNGALIELGLAAEEKSPTAVCPGPNIAYFDREYTLKEMVDHIYGRGESIVPADRPHMFAKEMEMYVDHLEGLVELVEEDPAELKRTQKFAANLLNDIDVAGELAEGEAYPSENLESLRVACVEQRDRVQGIISSLS